MPTDAHAEPVSGEAIPLQPIDHRRSFQVSPHMITFLGGVAVTLVVMYFCTQMGTKRRERD